MSRDAARFFIKRVSGGEGADSFSVWLDDLRESFLDEVGDMVVGDLGRSLIWVLEREIDSPSAMAGFTVRVIMKIANAAMPKPGYSQQNSMEHIRIDSRRKLSRHKALITETITKRRLE